MAIVSNYAIPRALMAAGYEAGVKARQQREDDIADQRKWQMRQAADARRGQLDAINAQKRMALANAVARGAGRTAPGRQDDADKIALEMIRQKGYDRKRQDDAQRQQKMRDDQLFQDAMKADDELYQLATRQRYKLEEEFDYSDAQLRTLASLNGQLGELEQRYSSGEITNEDFLRGRGLLRGKMAQVMPQTPKRPQKTPQELMDENLVTVDIGGNKVRGIFADGKFQQIQPQMADEFNASDALGMALKAATKKLPTGGESFDSKAFTKIYQELFNSYRWMMEQQKAWSEGRGNAPAPGLPGPGFKSEEEMLDEYFGQVK